MAQELAGAGKVDIRGKWFKVKKRDIIREIYETLPKLDCGLCGFRSCGQFARAVTEGRTSPFGCRQNPWSGFRISELIGMKMPAYGYEFQPTFVPVAGRSPSLKILGKKVGGLSQKAGDILARIEKLKGSEIQ